MGSVNPHSRISKINPINVSEQINKNKPQQTESSILDELKNLMFTKTHWKKQPLTDRNINPESDSSNIQETKHEVIANIFLSVFENHKNNMPTKKE
jgi:hypothetical protein